MPEATLAMAETPDNDSLAISACLKAVSEYSPIPSVHRSSNSIKPKLLGPIASSPIASTSATDSIAGLNAGGPPVLRQLLEEEDEEMAPTSRRELLHKDHFPALFGNAKTQNYLDPISKGPGSHT